MSKRTLSIFVCIFGFVVGIFGGFFATTYFTLPKTDILKSEETSYNDEVISGAVADISDSNISVHFLELGNKYTGDCTYIKTPTCDILIDCGSKSNSVATISNYLNKYITDGKIEYVIITHAHLDHYAGFATSAKVQGIFDLYECETIIDFEGVTNGKADTTTYKNYIKKRQAEENAGATHYTALECINGTSTFDIGGGYSLKILDSYFYHNVSATNENNNSVCCLVTNGTKNYLFTGDLEAEGEAELVSRNSLPEVDLYKAGHHGSKTSSSEALISVIRPKIVCVCCCAGSSEYKSAKGNEFPTQTFVDVMAKYNIEQIYVTTLCLDYDKNLFTSFNGNIVVMEINGQNKIWCSNNTTKLKDSEWFAKNRVWKQTA